MSGDLLSCPVCGQQPKRNGRGKAGGVVCRGPGEGVGKLHLFQTYGADQAEADAAWNARMTTQQDSVDVERLRAVEAEVERLRAVLVRICEEDRYTTRRKTNLNGGLRGHAGMIATFALTGKNGSYLTDADVRRHVTALSLPITQRDEQGGQAPTSDSSVYKHTFYGILNAQGEFWTPLAFESEKAATEHIVRVFGGVHTHNAKQCLRTHAIVPVRINLTAIRRLSIEQGDQDGGEG